MSKTISLIVAMAENRTIGRDNKMPWKLPADLKRFKELTTGHAVIMGRKTFDSIGKPLANRQNIVISRNPDFKAKGAEVAVSLPKALEAAKGDEVFVIGGEQIYNEALPLADRIYLTLIHEEIDGDAFFPEFDPTLFEETKVETFEDPLPYSFHILDRCRNGDPG